MRFEKKDIALLIPAMLLAIAGLGPDDPWVVGPCLFLSWITFIVICAIHEGQRKTRIIVGIVITLALCGVGYRRFNSIYHEPKKESQSTANKEQPPSVAPRLRPMPPEFAYMREPSKPRTLSLSRIEVTNFTGVPVRNKLTNKPGYFFNVYYENKGSAAATMLEHPDHLLSADELSTIQRQISEASDGPLDSYQEIQPGPPGQFFSFPLESDAGEMVGPAQDALSGKTRLYLFFQMKYRDANKPSARVKVTYFCGWFLDTFTMWHNCGTKIYSKP
jgi:hypothetical protein